MRYAKVIRLAHSAIKSIVSFVASYLVGNLFGPAILKQNATWVGIQDFGA